MKKPKVKRKKLALVSNEDPLFDDSFAYAGELDEMDDFAMADMHAIKDLLVLDPNDIEFRQRHAETDLAA